MIKRAGCYARVSTDEQAKFGYSIASQTALLEEHCQKNEIKIVDFYIDDGVSAGKPLHKRPAMQRLIDDVKAGKIDVILFTRLDRWYRSTKYYYQVQDILDKNNVAWQAVQEDYETTTSEGKFKVNIMLAVAEAERERGGERVRTVLANKVKNKEAIVNPHNMFYGYTKEKDENGVYRIVKNPELKDAMQYFWDCAIKYQNARKAGLETNKIFGTDRDIGEWHRVSAKEIYAGRHRGVIDYCEPYVSYDDFVKFNNRPRPKKPQQYRVYLFSGMMRCPLCGQRLASTYSVRHYKNGGTGETYMYRCKDKLGICEWRLCIGEKKIEAYLLDNLEEIVGKEIASVEIQKKKAKKKPKRDSEKLKEKLRRTNVSFIAGNMTDEQYLKETIELKEQIKKAEAQEEDVNVDKDIDGLKALLETDLRSLYETLDKEEKQTFWRSIINEIKIDENKNIIDIEFF